MASRCCRGGQPSTPDVPSRSNQTLCVGLPNLGGAGTSLGPAAANHPIGGKESPLPLASPSSRNTGKAAFVTYTHSLVVFHSVFCDYVGYVGVRVALLPFHVLCPHGQLTGGMFWHYLSRSAPPPTTSHPYQAMLYSLTHPLSCSE